MAQLFNIRKEDCDSELMNAVRGGAVYEKHLSHLQWLSIRADAHTSQLQHQCAYGRMRSRADPHTCKCVFLQRTICFAGLQSVCRVRAGRAVRVERAGRVGRVGRAWRTIYANVCSYAQMGAGMA